MSERCAYSHRPDDIHAFVFASAEREAIHDWAHQLEQVQLRGLWYNRRMVRLLVNASQSPYLNLRYLFECLADYNRAYPHLNPPLVRLAIVHHPHQEINEAHRLMPTLMDQQLQAEFFASPQASSAISWLLSD